MFSTLDITTAGLRAQRTRMDTIAGNVLNANTTRNADGESIPYRRRFAVLEAGDTNGNNAPGVHVSQIKQDPRPFGERYEPGHPDADAATGLVKTPNVDVGTEYVNMMEASRAYEANVSLMQTTKAMFNSALRMIA